MEIRHLHPNLGAEVVGVNLAREPATAVIDALREAFDIFGLLLFRQAQALTPQRQIAVTGWFGQLLAAGDDGEHWTTMSNDSAIGSAELRFHSDLTYTDAPFDGISLHALALPPGGSSTSFASGVAAWKRLSTQRQAQLRGAFAEHRLPATAMFGGDWPDFVARQPVCLSHPRTGEPVLYVTEEHVAALEDQPAALLAELFEELYAPKQVYVHHWQPYDLLVWDNHALQHARTAVADPADGPRVLQRVMLGQKTFQQVVAEVRAAG